MRGLTRFAVAAVAVALSTQPAQAGWKRIKIETTNVAKGAMEVAPDSEWNRWSRRPARQGETWTKDGFQLNQLDFFGQIADGDTIYRDRKKKDRPLPKFKTDMLLPDVATLFQSNFSIQNNITQFEVTEISPIKLGAVDGLKLTYDYALPGDRLNRKGEARMAVHEGRLYIVNYHAPKLHYFEKNVKEVRRIMDRIKLM